MSIFSETMTKAISNYRLLLRRYLQQTERMMKLRELKLRDSDIYESDIALYQVGKSIIKDIQNNMSMGSNMGYYSYSGVAEFAKYLSDYLDNYYVENNRVIHRAQKASRALMSSVQLMTLPRERLNDAVCNQLFDCNRVIANFGSQEQCDLQLQALMRQQASNPGFYTRIIAHLESLLQSDRSSAAA
jgi:hypothetical protein